MYHYVREFDKLHPKFRYLDIANFRKQLDFFSDNYGFVTKDDWLNFIDYGIIENSRDKILLTFDDALKCHYEYVYPELKRRGLFGFFYVPTYPYQSGDLLDVHKIHLLCGAFEGKQIYESLTNLINEDILQDKKNYEFSKNTYNSQTNYEYIKEIKRILNYYIDYKVRGKIIEYLANKLKYKFFPNRFYLSIQNIKELIEEGHIVGSHSINHLVMSKLSFSQQKNEIKNSFSFLEKIQSNFTKTYCHPYGGFHSFNDNTIKILNEENVKYSFNVESRDIQKKDNLESAQFLPRYDCNQFPFGQCS